VCASALFQHHLRLKIDPLPAEGGRSRLSSALQKNGTKGIVMNINLALTPLISLIAGILILIIPRLLNYIVALYLIVIGLIGLFGGGNFRL
jgi:Protein of unknown function (DUF3096)